MTSTFMSRTRVKAAKKIKVAHYRNALPQSAKEAATTFFDALARQDMAELMEVYPITAPPKWASHYASLVVISIGEPFQSWPYHGWFVPYEIMMNGHTKKHNLAVRNDNPSHRWVIDGGF